MVVSASGGGGGGKIVSANVCEACDGVELLSETVIVTVVTVACWGVPVMATFPDASVESCRPTGRALDDHAYGGVPLAAVRAAL